MLKSFIDYHLNAWTDAPDYAAPAGYRFESSRGKYCLLKCGPNEMDDRALCRKSVEDDRKRKLACMPKPRSVNNDPPHFYTMQGGRVGCPTDPQGRGTIHKILVQGERARDEHLARGYVVVVKP